MAKYKMYNHCVWGRTPQYQTNSYELLFATWDAARMMARAALENVLMLSGHEEDEAKIEPITDNIFENQTFAVWTSNLVAVIGVCKVDNDYGLETIEF